MIRLGLLLAGVAAAALPLAAQTDAPRFDVASVRPNQGTAGTSTWNVMPSGRFVATNSQLRNLIINAYGVTPDRLLGGPEWIDRDRFDILGSSPAGTPESTMLAMLRTLLADRFKLVLRKEAREIPVYALVVAQNDGRIEKALRPVDCTVARADPTTVIARAGAAPCSALLTRRLETGIVTYHAGGVNLDELANTLTARVGRPVINRTGRAGVYQFELSWLHELQAGSAVPAAGNDGGPSLFTALQEQLGLKLEPSRGAVEMLVVESVERPTPN